MTHEEFVERAQEAARNAQGLRPLAAHVRRLYHVIRALQGDDNAFCYIAEIIQKVRCDKRDASDFMTRVKTYFHRDRVARGDPLVERGTCRDEPDPAEAAVFSHTLACAQAPETQKHTNQSPANKANSKSVPATASDRPQPANPDVYSSGQDPTAGTKTESSENGQAHALRSAQGSLNPSVFGRPGHRRIVAGG